MPAELAAGLVASEADRLLQAEDLVRGFCGWHIAPARTETITVNGSGSPFLTLPTLHISEVTSVVEDGIELDLTSFEWSEAGQLWRSSPWSGHFRAVAVTLEHGYDTVPPVVEAIVQAVAQRAVDNPGSKPRAQVGPFADTYSQSGFNQAPALTLLDAEKAALSRYRVHPRP